MELSITKLKRRDKPQGQLVRMSWEELLEKLRYPQETKEPLQVYQQMTGQQRHEEKDVGGFVGGVFANNYRNEKNVISRSLVAIDADDATQKNIWDFKGNTTTGNPLYVYYSTHSSTPEHLRLRWLFPLSRPVSAEEYRRLARIIGRWVGEESLDPETYDPSRMMFWPSVPLGESDKYLFEAGGIAPVDPDDLLGREEDEVSYEPPEQEVLSDPPPVSSGGIVYEGERNSRLHKFGVSCTSNGIEGQELLAKMREWNETYCADPLEDKEVVTIYKSVQRNGRRPVTSEQDFSDMGEYVKREDSPLPTERKDPDLIELSFMSVVDLMAQDIKEPEYVVKDLILEGLTVIASPPKYGKSWLSFDLGFAVSNGTEFLGLPTKEAGVLYLALEDSPGRLAKRLKLVQGNRERRSNFICCTTALGLNDGLVKQLEFALAKEPTLKLIIIDTLQKVRGMAKKTEGVYGYDYRELSVLQKFALTHGISVVLIHHLNKGGDDSDFVSRLNGSTGLSGAADSIIAMTRANRGDDLTKMSIVGRDVMERTLMLRMDWAKYRWECLGDERDFHESEEEQAYHTSGLIKAVQYKMDELEDTLLSSGEELEEIVWQTDGKSLRDFVNTNQHEDITSNSVLRNKLEGFKPLLLDLAAIRYNYDTESKRFIFKRSVS